METSQLLKSFALMAEKTGESVCSGSRVVDNQSPVLLSSDGTLNITSSLDAALAPGTGVQNEVKFPDADNLVPNSVTYQVSDSRSQLTTQKLYGGAITMQIPGSFQDVSTIREVRQIVDGTSGSV